MFNNCEQLFKNEIEEISSFKQISKIVMLFLFNPEQELNVRAISKKTGYSLGKTSAALNKLNKNEILTYRALSKLKLFKADWNSVTFLQFKKLLNSSISKKELMPIFPLCKKIILFGSWAKGTNTFDSDVDIFIETEEKEKIIKILKKIGVWASSNIKNSIEYIQLKREHPTFARKIEEGIVLWEREN